MSNETNTAEATTQATAPAGQAPAGNAAPVELTVQDLGVIRSVIDVATQRGAFRANELEAVGKTYNKLDTFLQTIQKAEEEAKANQEGAAEAKTAETAKE